MRTFDDLVSEADRADVTGGGLPPPPTLSSPSPCSASADTALSCPAESDPHNSQESRTSTAFLPWPPAGPRAGLPTSGPRPLPLQDRRPGAGRPASGRRRRQQAPAAHGLEDIAVASTRPVGGNCPEHHCPVAARQPLTRHHHDRTENRCQSCSARVRVRQSSKWIVHQASVANGSPVLHCFGRRSASGTLLTVRSGPKWLVHPFGRDAG